MSLRAVIHLLLHAAIPALLALLFWRPQWVRAWMWMLAAFVIDLDHLLADPVYAPDRCSVGFHPLHTTPAVAAYAGLAVYRRTRWFGVGLLLHVSLDALDCVLMR
jgi:hypothetical protein